MQKKRFVAIGHIVNDTEPVDHLGGPVSYASVAATRLGYESHVITKCQLNHPYIKQLESYGVSVIVLPSSRNNITTNRNIYDAQGYKTQYKLAQQENITLQDLQTIPKDLLKDAQIVIGSDTGEVAQNLFPHLAKLGTLSIFAQGYFRKVTKNMMVVPKSWTGSARNMAPVHAVVFGDEEILENGKMNESMLEKVIIKPKITAFTVGIRGSMIFTRNGEQIEIKAFPVKPDEIKEYNGAGDIYAVGFVTRLAETQNLKEAGMFASLFAGLKLMGFGGVGIDSIPTKEQMEDFLAKHPERLQQFYTLNFFVVDEEK